MQCLEASERMSLHLDGELSKDESEGLEQHLTTCDDCRVEWEMMQRASALFSHAALIAPPPMFVDKVMARVQQRTARLVILCGLITLFISMLVLVAVIAVPLRAFSTLTNTVSVNPAVVSTIVGFSTGLVAIAGTLCRAVALIVRAVFSESHHLAILGYLLLTGGLTLCWLHLTIWPVRAPAHSTRPRGW